MFELAGDPFERVFQTNPCGVEAPGSPAGGPSSGAFQTNPCGVDQLHVRLPRQTGVFSDEVPRVPTPSQELFGPPPNLGA